ncbi:MAG: hypothetical protein WC410_01595 [Candidatus Paceibacterota bacterium]
MRKRIYFLIFFFCLFPLFWVEADTLNQKTDFVVDSGYSISGENKVSATLRRVSPRLYFYFEDEWWNNLNEQEIEEIGQILVDLGNEFDSAIYLKATSLYGSEWIPGIDKDSKITVLFYPMKENTKGYFRSVDEYEKIVAPMSNQREIIYLNADNIRSAFLDEFLAHEFAHLIIFNQKERQYNVSEDVWLNEARAEYLITYLGYNQKENSYLKSRIDDFLERSSDSLTQWDGEVYDYGIINMFIHYLVDQYGPEVLSESLKTSKTGVESINYALNKLGKTKTFADIFSDWAIAAYLNDCSYSQRYCYKDGDLDDLQLIPFNNFLPLSGESSLSVGQTLSAWSAHWQKFSGARSDLKIDFDGKSQDNLRVFYIIKDFSGNYEVKEMALDASKKGTVTVLGMGKDKSSVILIPVSLSSSSNLFYSITATTFSQPNENQGPGSEIQLPFEVSKPLGQMNREELLSVLLRLIIYLLLQGKLVI